MSESMANDAPSIRAARVVLPCENLGVTLAFFIERLGFRLDRITPADDPRLALISGHGLNLELRRGLGQGSVAPNGTRIVWVPHDLPMTVPPGQQELVVCHAAGGSDVVTGRAGMQYRDLLPSRFGGRFIVSQIRIESGGPVPDLVHSHAVRFQMIYCLEGWVRVAYQDQGPPLRMQAGDCFLQPPGIRHRVLESSPGLEVLEIGCPAEHETLIDHELSLPTERLSPLRDFGGQRFVHHIAATAPWQACQQADWEARDTGIAAATGKLACVRAVRPRAAPARRSLEHAGEFLFVYVLSGMARLEGTGEPPVDLETGSSAAIPAGMPAALVAASQDLALLEVRLPAPADHRCG